MAKCGGPKPHEAWILIIAGLRHGGKQFGVENRADLPADIQLEALRRDRRREPAAVLRPDIGDAVIGITVPVVHRPAGGAGEAGTADLSAGAIPYFAWANRGAEAMRVWIPG